MTRSSTSISAAQRGRPRYREITKLLEANTGANRLASVFDDFVRLSAITFRNAVDRHGRDEREELYLRTAGKYTAEQMDRFAQALALVVLAMEEEPCDVLGRLYMGLDLGNENLGQFFTPFDVARLVAAMNAETLTAQVREHGFAELYEPACGAGAFVVAAALEMQRAGLNYQRQLHVTAEDISAEAVHMIYVHLSLLHIPAVVRRANTLTGEVFQVWPTPAHILGGWARKVARPVQDHGTALAEEVAS
jgi:hypothetical protein